MGQAWFLVGRPGVGKTTCLRRTLERWGGPAGGFLTAEIREAGRRVGFALETLDGRRGVLAHAGRPGPPRVGRYGVDLAVLEELGIPALAAAARAGHLVVVDEVGKMELASAAFRHAVEALLEGPARLLGTILAAPHPWADRIKAHPRVRLVEVTEATRDTLPERLAAWLGDPRACGAGGAP